MDASFRLVLETWLSYIQPWRYSTNYNDKNVEAGGEQAVDSSKWTSFVDENYRFYTNLLGKILASRFFRVDLSAHKNAYMLYRIVKVFHQENLMNILNRVSSMQGGSLLQVHTLSNDL